jgi:hypothetical protein
VATRRATTDGPAAEKFLQPNSVSVQSKPNAGSAGDDLHQGCAAMDLTVEQINALAPDASAAAAGKKLAEKKHWPTLGQSAVAIWGECQGSALYQVKVDLSAFAYNCTCPSRKLPCKHVLGLLLLTARIAGDVKAAEAPEWVVAWLDKRAATAKKKEEKKQDAAAKPVDEAAQAKRAEKRQANVSDGVEQLDLWLGDLVRGGLAGLEMKPPSYWEDQSRRLIDAQAKGLATRLKRIGEIPGSGADWPSKVLGELGRLSLLTHAFRGLEHLDAGLQSDVRQLVGWTIDKDELAAQGEKVADEWLVLGQTLEDEDRLKVQRHWLLGRTSRRTALVLQFAVAGQPFPESIPPATAFEGDLIYYPSAAPQRAMIHARRQNIGQIAKPLPATSIAEHLRATAEALARLPWNERSLAVLKNVRFAPRPKEPWLVVDERGDGLPLRRGGHWTLLALAGGWMIDFAGVWDGEMLTPLGLFVDGMYRWIE